jgi:hypothetical protein
MGEDGPLRELGMAEREAGLRGLAGPEGHMVSVETSGQKKPAVHSDSVVDPAGQYAPENAKDGRGWSA